MAFVHFNALNKSENDPMDYHTIRPLGRLWMISQFDMIHYWSVIPQHWPTSVIVLR